MSSSRSDDVTQFVRLSVCPFVCMSHFLNIIAFEANFDVLMFLVFQQCLSSVSPVFHKCFTSVSQVFHNCFTNVSKGFYGYFKSNQEVFQEVF